MVTSVCITNIILVSAPLPRSYPILRDLYIQLFIARIQAVLRLAKPALYRKLAWALQVKIF